MSSEMGGVGTSKAEYLRFQSKADLLWVSRSKARSKDESMIQRLEIPVLHIIRIRGHREILNPGMKIPGVEGAKLANRLVSRRRDVSELK